jgi:hypothetical protein
MTDRKAIRSSLVFCLSHLVLKPGQKPEDLAALMKTELADKHGAAAEVRVLLFDGEVRAATARFSERESDYLTVRIERINGKWQHDRRPSLGNAGAGMDEAFYPRLVLDTASA